MSLNCEPPQGEGVNCLILGESAWEWQSGYLPHQKPVFSFLSTFICGQYHNTAQLPKRGKVAGLINWSLA